MIQLQTMPLEEVAMSFPFPFFLPATWEMGMMTGVQTGFLDHKDELFVENCRATKQENPEFITALYP